MNKDPKLQEILAHQLYLMNAKDKGYNDLVKKIIQNQIRNTIRMNILLLTRNTKRRSVNLYEIF